MSAIIDVEHITGISNGENLSQTQTEQSPDGRDTLTSESKVGHTVHDHEQQTAMISPSKANSLASTSNEDTDITGMVRGIIMTF